jgi:hypothetical protein
VTAAKVSLSDSRPASTSSSNAELQSQLEFLQTAFADQNVDRISTLFRSIPPDQESHPSLVIYMRFPKIGLTIISSNTGLAIAE